MTRKIKDSIIIVFLYTAIAIAIYCLLLASREGRPKYIKPVKKVKNGRVYFTNE